MYTHGFGIASGRGGDSESRQEQRQQHRVEQQLELEQLHPLSLSLRLPPFSIQRETNTSLSTFSVSFVSPYNTSYLSVSLSSLVLLLLLPILLMLLLLLLLQAQREPTRRL